MEAPSKKTMTTLCQPNESEWRFVQELQEPLHTHIALSRTEPRPGEADLNRGVSLNFDFPDPEGLLQTATVDFCRFLTAAQIPQNGPFEIITGQASTTCFEAYRIEITETACRILANDTEGIRRGLVFLEDEILRADGPFLPLNTSERKPVIRSRITRCFFGPINRPPKNRDELMDDVDYYPDEYLNRLVHEGVNGLWLSITFRDMCTSDLFPGHGQDAERRLAKLRATVAKCRRYGIKIYLYCNEPACFGPTSHYMLPMEHLAEHPELGGHGNSAMRYFCTSSEKGRAYVRECTRQIFAGAPGLGGLINICFGEHPTHCNCSFQGALHSNCPRCSKLGAEAATANMLSAFAEGMHEVDPLAECIAWFYVPVMWDVGGIPIDDQKAYMRRVMARLPNDVICQYNFESNGTVIQQGKERTALDYWLAWPGPSAIFEDCARNAIVAGARVSAKIQVGCSHEVATVPFVPVPGNLFRKYRAMHKLGVSAVMQCWYFGNYPGIMNKAAGELAFAPFPENEDTFLNRLAEPIWGRHAETAVRAWKLFAEGYSQFPVVLPFTWFGPVHDAVVWPLHLFPADQRIAPSWLLQDFNSGDRIGECICYEHTLDEAVELLEAMAQKWSAGVALLQGIAPDVDHSPERLRDISVAQALGIQMISARNVFQFYQLRERLPDLSQVEQRSTLSRMKQIVVEELGNGPILRELCRNDSRLGFHSEAEGYKYFPVKIDWRIEQLQELLRTDVPRLEQQIEAEEELFPEYTGRRPTGPAYSCPASPEQAEWHSLSGGTPTEWKAYHDATSLTFEFRCAAPGPGDAVTIEIEPRRLWPIQTFTLFPDGTAQHSNKGPRQDRTWSVDTHSTDDTWHASVNIPFQVLKRDDVDRPVRINIIRTGINGTALLVEKHPLPPRLLFGDSNPADLAWLLLEIWPGTGNRNVAPGGNS